MIADDLQFYAAENFTDADDAGGYPSNNRVLDNVDNNVFPDVASGDRIGGRTHLRKIFASVRSPDTEVLMASRAYISLPPTDPAVSIGILVTGNESDTRVDALEALYTAAQKNLNTNLRLYQTYYDGETVISVYHYDTQVAPFLGSWPKVGDIICLEDDSSGAEQYVRVSSISVSDLIEGYQSATITFDPPLRFVFAGGFSSVTTYITPTQIYNTRSIPMGHGVYGITPLSVAASDGESVVTVDEVTVPIAPTISSLVNASYRPSSSVVRKSKTETAIDSRMQTTTLSPMPSLNDISVSYSQNTGSYYTIHGNSSPGLFAVSDTSITVTLPSSPFSTIANTYKPSVSSSTTTSYTHYFNKALKTGSIAISALVSPTNTLLAGRDDGAGNLTGVGISGTVNYSTGVVSITFTSSVYLNTIQINTSTLEDVTEYGNGSALSVTSSYSLINLKRPINPSSITITANKYSDGSLITGTDNGSGVISGTGISGSIDYQNANLSFATFSEQVYSVSIKVQYQYWRNITFIVPNGNFPVSSHSATLGYAMNAGKVTVNAITPEGVTLLATDDGAGAFNQNGITGTVNYGTGAVALSFADDVLYSSITIYSEFRGATSPIVWGYSTADDGDSFVFSLKTPIDPGSIDISATAVSDSSVLIVNDDGLGALTGDASGTIHYINGQLSIVFSEAVTIQSIVIAYRYTAPSAVNQILGGTLDVVRLPPSKSYPLAKVGDMAIIHYPKSEPLPSPAVSETTYALSRANVQQIWIEDATGTKIPTAKYTANLIAGMVTMATGLDLSGYTQPLVAWTVISDEAIITEIDSNSKKISLSAALTHDYPASASYLSSQIPIGDLQAQVTTPFSQQAWTSTWSNVIIGNEITPQFNHIVFPIVVSNDGAIAERWRIQFTGTTTVNVIGEHVGQIATALSITGVIAPINPQTGKAYFTIPLAGWGAGWVNGNVLRFNTESSSFGTWPIRVVQPSVHVSGASDRFRLTFLGDIDA